MAEKKRYSKERIWKIGQGNAALDMRLYIGKGYNGSPHIEFEVRGALHPYLRGLDRPIQYLGDETKNPALLPVVKFLTQEFQMILEKELASTGYILAGKSNAEDMAVHTSPDGYSTHAEIQKKESALGILLPNISDKKLDKLFAALEKRIEHVIPAAVAEIERNKHLQPDENVPDDVRKEVIKNVFRAQYSASDEAQQATKGKSGQWVEGLNQMRQENDEPDQGKHRWN